MGLCYERRCQDYAKGVANWAIMHTKRVGGVILISTFA